MLDFFLLRTPPSEEDYVNGISLQEHSLLSEIWDECAERGVKVSFFSDARLSAAEIEKVVNVLDSKQSQQKTWTLEKSIAFQKVLMIFESGKMQGTGMIIVCD